MPEKPEPEKKPESSETSEKTTSETMEKTTTDDPWDAEKKHKEKTRKTQDKPKPKVTLPVIGTLVTVSALLIALILGTFFLIKSIQDGFEEKVTQAQTEQAEKTAAQESKMAKAMKAKEAEIEAKARALVKERAKTADPRKIRREPPTIVRVDEFVVDTGGRAGEVVIGIPVISLDGNVGPYLGSQPPATEIKFAHDSKWAKAAEWQQIQIAQYDEKNQEWVSVPGIPKITRTMPDGSEQYQTHVWALVMPTSS